MWKGTPATRHPRREPRQLRLVETRAETTAEDALRVLARVLAREVVAELPPSEHGPAVARADYLDRRSAGLGPEEWRKLTRAVPSYRVGRRLLVKREDFRAWVEAHRVARGERGPDPDSPSPEPDAFERALAEGRLRVVRPPKK